MNQAQRAWKANPQAMAAVSKRSFIEPHPELSVIQDADTWLTPRWILDQLGKFDLDPCAAAGFSGLLSERRFNDESLAKRAYRT